MSGNGGRPAAKGAEAGARRLPRWAPWAAGLAVVWAFAAALVYYWRMIFDLPAAVPALPATLCAAGVFSLLYLALFLLCRAKGAALCAKAAAAVFVTGLLFCFFTAPLQAPDENAHYLRAVSLSYGRLTFDYDESYPRDVEALVQAFPPQLNHRAVYAGGDMAPAAFREYGRLKSGGAAVRGAEPPVMFVLLPFVPQALFMAAARLFGGGAAAMLYAGRAANLVCYTLLCYLAFRNCRRYRGLFFAFALLPLPLFMAASCSYDSLLLGGCLFLLSYLCRDAVNARALAVFIAALALCASVKPVNALLAGVLLLIPKERYTVKFSRAAMAAAAVAAAALAWWLTGMAGEALKRGWPDTLPRGVGEGADPAAQLLFVLQNPLRFAAAALLSAGEGDGFLFGMGRLGWMDMVLPAVGGLSVLSLAAACALCARGGGRFPRGAECPAAGLAAMALLYAGAVTAGIYVLESHYTSIRVTGLQPRYFLPAFVLLFLVCGILLGRAVPARRTQAQAARADAAALCIAAGLAVFAAVLLFQHTFVGQWVPKAEGGYALINLFGRQTS